MLKISAAQMNILTRNHFFRKVMSFISANCRNDRLLAKVADSEKMTAFWTPHWERASKLSEHDCALFLVLLSICECEDVAVPDVDALVDQVRDGEVRIKQFIADRGYLRFSDFDYPSGRDDGAQHG
jgi:hypothetical protein